MGKRYGGDLYAAAPQLEFRQHIFNAKQNAAGNAVFPIRPGNRVSSEFEIGGSESNDEKNADKK